MIILIIFLQRIFNFIFKLPPPAAVYLMRFAAESAYQIARLTKVKKIAAKNIALFFPRSDTGLLADKLLRNVGYSIFEILCTPFFEEAHLKRICKINGLENLDLALAKRRGAIMISMHTGNYELIATALAARGYGLASVLKADPADPLFKIISPSRAYKGIKIINVLKENMYRETLKALARNRTVCLLADTGALEGRHEMLPFLGKKVPVATGWLTLARRSGAPVVPVISRREGKKLIINFYEPLFVYKDNRGEIMLKIGKLFENFVENHPEQWGIFLNEYETKRMVEGK